MVDYLLIVLLSVSILCRGNHWLVFLCLLWFGVVWYLVGSACWMLRFVVYGCVFVGVRRLVSALVVGVLLLGLLCWLGV